MWRPERRAFWEDAALPALVLGPVACFHGLVLRIFSACLARRSLLQPFVSIGKTCDPSFCFSIFGGGGRPRAGVMALM